MAAMEETLSLRFPTHRRELPQGELVGQRATEEQILLEERPRGRQVLFFIIIPSKTGLVEVLAEEALRLAELVIVAPPVLLAEEAALALQRPTLGGTVVTVAVSEKITQERRKVGQIILEQPQGGVIQFLELEGEGLLPLRMARLQEEKAGTDLFMVGREVGEVRH